MSPTPPFPRDFACEHTVAKSRVFAVLASPDRPDTLKAILTCTDPLLAQRATAVLTSLALTGGGPMTELKPPSSKPAFKPKTGSGPEGDKDEPSDELSVNGLENIVEFLHAQSGAHDVDATKRAAGEDKFKKKCTDCHEVDEGKTVISDASSSYHSARTTMYPTTRDRNTTKVLTTPWISVSVTMSPFATCEISWPRTASTSSLVIVSSKPVDTATSAEFLNAPVANALASPS